MTGSQRDAALITALTDFLGITVTEVAKRAKVDPETLRKAMKGKTSTRLSQRTLEKLQAAYPQFPGWAQHYAQGLSAYAADRQHQISTAAQANSDSVAFDRPVTERPDSDTLAIPMIELAYGMGGTFLDSVDVGETMERFPRAFVRMLSSAPANQLCFTYGIGDSMYPTIGDRDLILIDRSRTSLHVNDQIWVLAVNGIGMVKRVRVESDGQVLLHADNKEVREYAVAEGELNIIGRVVAVVRRT